MTRSPPKPPPESALRVVIVRGLADSCRIADGLANALREAGGKVTQVSLSERNPRSEAAEWPTFGEIRQGLSDLVHTVSSSLGGVGAPPMHARDSLEGSAGPADVVITLEAKTAEVVFRRPGAPWPQALHVGVVSDFEFHSSWFNANLDDLIVPHRSLTSEFDGSSRSGPRIHTAGPFTSGGVSDPRVLHPGRPMVVLCFSQMEESEIESFLFQLSLIEAENLSFLFLPSGRPGVDAFLKAKAAQFGLMGKRIRPGSDAAPWMAGASAVLGAPTPREVVQAVQARAPLLLFGAGGQANHLLVAEGAALHIRLAITLGGTLESVLPGGARREKALAALETVDAGGLAAVVNAIYDAGRLGKPARLATVDASPDQDELETIGFDEDPPVVFSTLETLDDRRGTLQEVILGQKRIEARLAELRGDLSVWTRRRDLAEAAQRPDLLEPASEHVGSLETMLNHLENRLSSALALRDRLAGGTPFGAEERKTLAQVLDPSPRTGLGAAGGEERAFSQLEVDAALQELKAKLKGSA